MKFRGREGDFQHLSHYLIRIAYLLWTINRKLSSEHSTQVRIGRKPCVLNRICIYNIFIEQCLWPSNYNRMHIHHRVFSRHTYIWKTGIVCVLKCEMKEIPNIVFSCYFKLFKSSTTPKVIWSWVNNSDQIDLFIIKHETEAD